MVRSAEARPLPALEISDNYPSQNPRAHESGTNIVSTQITKTEQGCQSTQQMLYVAQIKK